MSLDSQLKHISYTPLFSYFLKDVLDNVFFITFNIFVD